MKILFLTPYVPSKRAGGENFTRQLLIDLSRENKIDLIYYKYAADDTYVSPSDNIRVLKVLNNSNKIKLLNYLKKPFMHPIFNIRFSNSLLSYIKSMITKESYDIIYLDHSQMFLYGKYLKNVPKIMMAHDVMGQRYDRQGNTIMKKMILSTEGKLMRLPNTTVFSFSSKDKYIIKQLYGVDSMVTHFYLDDMVIKATPIHIENRLIFFGKWKRADNYDGLVWFFENVYQKINSDIKISIIGGWLPEDFQIKYCVKNKVEYLGFVDNPYQLISNSIAVLSPLFSGAGVKVKVVESLACGTPVIGNNIAFEGIGKEFSQFMMYANSAEEYVSQISKLLSFGIEERLKYKVNFLHRYAQNSITDYLKQNF